MFVTDLPDTKSAHLSPEHSETIRATLPLVGENIETITRVFYSKNRVPNRKHWRHRWPPSPRSWLTRAHPTR